MPRALMQLETGKPHGFMAARPTMPYGISARRHVAKRVHIN